MNPVEEAGKMRNVILKDYPGSVAFMPNDSGYVFSQIDEMLHADPSSSILVGANHGDLVSLYEKGSLRPLDSEFASLSERSFAPALVSLSKLDGKSMFYIPWTQATYVMAASTKALKYLPKGAKLESLSYDQLEEWAKTIFEKTGMKALGFPAGKNGLMHRFFQGYLYPSFTASTLLKYRSPEAQAMWAYFKGLWQYVHPGSLVYSTMAEPLLTGDVWIAWDHTARLVKAFEERQKDFVAFPAPIGPKGRGFMAIIAGLAIPKAVASADDAMTLIDYLTQPAIQARTMSETGFLPVDDLGKDTPPPVQFASLKAAVDAQTYSKQAIPTLAPIGLGESGADFNNLYLLTFSEIVLEGRDIPKTLDVNRANLQAVIDKAKAKSWLPDVSNERPCKIE